MKVLLKEELNIIETNLSDTSNLLDEKIYTQVEASDEIYLKLQTNLIDNIAFFNLDAKEIELKLLDGDEVITEKNISLAKEEFSDIWGYFYDDFEFIETLYEELFTIPNAILEIKIKGDTPKVGLIYIGRGYFIGYSKYEAGVGMRDYSKIIENEEDPSDITYEIGKFSRFYQGDIYIEPSSVAKIGKVLKNLRGKRRVFVANKADEAKILYGYFKAYEPMYVSSGKAVYNLEIEGVA